VEGSEYEKGMTSKRLAEDRYMGASLEAKGCSVSLGLTLFNNFCMGKKIAKKREQDGVEGKKGG